MGCDVCACMSAAHDCETSEGKNEKACNDRFECNRHGVYDMVLGEVKEEMSRRQRERSQTGTGTGSQAPATGFLQQE